MKTIPAAFRSLSRRGIFTITIAHDARFCQSCHIMEEPFQKWAASPHHLVTCHECHKHQAEAQ